MNVNNKYQQFFNLSKRVQFALLLQIKVVGFIVIWLLLVLVFTFFSDKRQFEPTVSFNICVIKDHKPTLVRIDEQNNLPLCQQNHKNVTYHDTPLFTFSLESIEPKNNEWQITDRNGSMSDPLVYRYRVVNNRIEPLWFSHGGDIREALRIFGAFILTFFVFSLMQVIVKSYINNKLADNQDKN